MNKYSILRGKNDWLKNYRGHTFSDRLQSEIIKGVFEEHAKFKYNVPFLKNGMYEQLGKKCLIACIESNTKELLAVGSSSLLKDESTGEIVDNLILDNFGSWFAGIYRALVQAGKTASMKDDGAVARNILMYGTGFSQTYNDTDSGTIGTSVRMGSGTTPPGRGDTAIQTALATAPESGYLNTNDGAFTSNNTIIYQADANPTGGTGTVNESGSFWAWLHTGSAVAKFMHTHDAVSPNIPFTAGKLLRAAYIWSI